MLVFRLHLSKTILRVKPYFLLGKLATKLRFHVMFNFKPSQIIKIENLGRVVVVACSPLMHEETFRKTVAEARLNPYLPGMVNLRGHVSWVHFEKSEEASVKAKDLIRMGVARAKLLEPLQREKGKRREKCSCCRHPKIKLLTYAKVERVLGHTGN